MENAIHHRTGWRPGQWPGSPPRRVDNRSSNHDPAREQGILGAHAGWPPHPTRLSIFSIPARGTQRDDLLNVPALVPSLLQSKSERSAPRYQIHSVAEVRSGDDRTSGRLTRTHRRVRRISSRPAPPRPQPHLTDQARAEERLQASHGVQDEVHSNCK